MELRNDIGSRFGSKAAQRLAELVGAPPEGDLSFNPASRDRCRGALIGATACETLHVTLRGNQPSLGPDTRLTLLTADALLSGVDDHPMRFAARLATTHVRGAGRAVRHACKDLKAGRAWWEAGASNAAGTAAAARSSGFGLLWAGDPARAAYEAALSATVTHGHPAGVAGAAGFAAAVALAANGKGPLDEQWLVDAANICEGYPQGEIYGITVADNLRRLPSLLGAALSDAMAEIGDSALATEAVPLALLGAVMAPMPFGNAFDSRAGIRYVKQVARLHPACRAMMGACIGARHGMGGIGTDRLTRVRGIDEVLATADRIAGRRVRPVNRPTDSGNTSDAETPVHISFLIDRSGSMSGLRSDVVDGFNGFVDEQRKKSGECALTLVQFDSNDPYEVIHEAVPVHTAPDLAPDQYQPRGATPLLDALGALIEKADTRLESIGGEEDQIVAVFTDGLENASRRWSRDKLFEVITDRRNAGWIFVFMGANQDSYAEAGRLGLDDRSVQNFAADRRGVPAAFGSFNRAVGEYREMPRQDRLERKGAFFGERKEAEEDLERRKGSPPIRREEEDDPSSQIAT